MLQLSCFTFFGKLRGVGYFFFTQREVEGPLWNRGPQLETSTLPSKTACYNRADHSSLMSRHSILFLAALSLLVPPLAGAQSSQPGSGAWSGTIVYSSCNADEAFNESPECFRAAPGAKLSLYDDTNRVMYSLEPQELAASHLGDSVTVRGTLDGETIHASSVELMSIGLPAGQKAPDFSLRDQSGQTQTLDSLKGANGTVLLFFRSADW